MKRCIILTLIAILMLGIVSSFVCETQAIGIKDINANASKQQSGNNDTSELINVGNIVVKTIRVLGESIAVTTLAIVGIRYIMGSVEEKAEYKQTMWIYIIAAILLFGGSALTQIIYDIYN